MANKAVQPELLTSEEYAKYGILKQFDEEYAPYVLDQNSTNLLVNGGLEMKGDTVDVDVEANLDISTPRH